MMKKMMVKTPQQIEAIRQAGKYHNQLLLILRDAAKAGTSLIELEQIAVEFLKEHKLKGSFKGYNGYPANLCLSVNDCVVHGIPDNYVLKNGDLLKIDLGITYKGCMTDAAISVIVGGEHTNPEAAGLLEATKNGLDECIRFFGAGRAVYDRSYAISHYVTQKGYSVIKPLTGHGTGKYVHEAPTIYNYPHPESKKTILQKNLVIAVEPITAITSTDYVERPRINNRNLYTSHGDVGCQREYTLLITENGYEILAGIQ